MIRTTSSKKRKGFNRESFTFHKVYMDIYYTLNKRERNSFLKLLFQHQFFNQEPSRSVSISGRAYDLIRKEVRIQVEEYRRTGNGLLNSVDSQMIAQVLQSSSRSAHAYDTRALMVRKKENRKKESKKQSLHYIPTKQNSKQKNKKAKSSIERKQQTSPIVEEKINPLVFHNEEMSIASKERLCRAGWFRKEYEGPFVDWLTYKKTQFNFTYKSNLSLKQIFSKLISMADNSPKIAEQIISHSIASGYTGMWVPPEIQDSRSKPEYLQVKNKYPDKIGKKRLT